MEDIVDQTETTTEKPEDKKKKYRVISYVILIAAACFILYFLVKFAFSGTGFDPAMIKRWDSTITHMNTKIDSVEEYQKFLIERSYIQEARSIELKDDIDKINAQVKKTNKEISDLRKAYNDKINSIDGYSVSQIDSFFRARYGFYY